MKANRRRPIRGKMAPMPIWPPPTETSRSSKIISSRRSSNSRIISNPRNNRRSKRTSNLRSSRPSSLLRPIRASSRRPPRTRIIPPTRVTTLAQRTRPTANQCCRRNNLRRLCRNIPSHPVRVRGYGLPTPLELRSSGLLLGTGSVGAAAPTGLSMDAGLLGICRRHLPFQLRVLGPAYWLLRWRELWKWLHWPRLSGWLLEQQPLLLQPRRQQCKRHEHYQRVQPHGDQQHHDKPGQL